MNAEPAWCFKILQTKGFIEVNIKCLLECLSFVYIYDVFDRIKIFFFFLNGANINMHSQ